MQAVVHENTRRILIVDAHEPSRLVIAIHLRLRGYQCIAVASYEEALRTIDEFRPNVIVIEWATRAGRHIDLVDGLRSHAARVDAVPRIVVVTHEHEAPNASALATVDAYFKKPVDFPILEEFIRSAVDEGRVDQRRDM